MGGRGGQGGRGEQGEDGERGKEGMIGRGRGRGGEGWMGWELCFLFLSGSMLIVFVSPKAAPFEGKVKPRFGIRCCFCCC